MALRPAIDRPVPGRSSLGESGSRESGTSAKAPIRHAATTGRLIRKMLLQSKCSSRKPPEIGPIATPSPDTAAQMAIAFGRSFDGKMFVRIDSVVGMIPAAPRPMSAREAISMVASVERAAKTDPSPNTTNPDDERALAPEAITEAARGEQQAGEHQQVAVDDPLQLARARVELLADVGRPTLRIVLPIVITSRLSASTPSACQRRGYGCIGVSFGGSRGLTGSRPRSPV